MISYTTRLLCKWSGYLVWIIKGKRTSLNDECDVDKPNVKYRNLTIVFLVTLFSYAIIKMLFKSI